MNSFKRLTEVLSDNIPKPIADGWSYLDQIPQHEFYRLVVDANLVVEEKGPLAYENREKGCIQAFMLALQYCRDLQGRQIKFKDMVMIHALASSHFKRDQNFPTLRSNCSDAHISNDRSTVSVAGLEQYLDAIENEGHVCWGRMYIGGYNLERNKLPALKQKLGFCNNQQLARHLYSAMGPRVQLFPPKKHHLTAVVAYLCSYYFNLDKMTDPIDKIRLLVGRLCQPKEVLHVHNDTNIRSTIILLLNTLLMNEGLPPAIFADPNRFDFHSVDECVQMVIDGMNLTLKLIEDKKLPGFSFADLCNEDQGKVKEITRPVSSKMVSARLEGFAGFVDLEKMAEGVQSNYDFHLGDFDGDPLLGLHEHVKISRVGESLWVVDYIDYFKKPLAPINECLTGGFYYPRHLWRLSSFLTGDHCMRLVDDAVSEQGLCALLNKMEAEGRQFHSRIGFLVFDGVGTLYSNNLKQLKNKHRCQTNAQFAKKLFSSIKKGFSYVPLCNDTELTISECLVATRQHYETQIAGVKSYREKIEIIVNTIQELILVMPYRKDNDKKILPLIDKLLIENGLPPTTGLQGSNSTTKKFILHSPTELADIVIKSCCLTLGLCRGKITVDENELASPKILYELNDLLQQYAKSQPWLTYPEIPIDTYLKHEKSSQDNCGTVNDQRL